MDHSSPPSSEEDLPSSHPARRREFGSKHETAAAKHGRGSGGGWGEAMELAHQQEHSQKTSDSKGRSSSSSAVAVDLNQFRNTEVGKGYQAKHVVRQKTAADSAANLKTRTVNNDFTVVDHSKRETENDVIDTEELLKNDGLRAFRKELESILSS